MSDQRTTSRPDPEATGKASDPPASENLAQTGTEAEHPAVADQPAIQGVPGILPAQYWMELEEVRNARAEQSM